MHKFYIFLITAVISLPSFSQEFYDESHRINREERSTAIPSYPDLFFEYRIAELNKNTPVELEYNEAVRYYIDLYTIHRREEFAGIIGLSELYFPFFDEMLARFDLPLELKYLTIVESALNPLAVSKSGAVGLWQFLLNTGRLFDLEINSYIDERRDPFISTEAACRYLKYLYSTFNDWQLVLSSYNGGPGDVRKAIERSDGAVNYWEIRPHLSEQAQNYVPAFIAVAYLMKYYHDHHITPVPPPYKYHDLDTLRISYYLTFSQISGMLDIPVEEIRFLNPVYKLDVIPEMSEPAVLILPEEKITLFIQNETRILGRDPEEEDYHTMINNAKSTDNKIQIIHVVEKGEFFHKIALKYNCTLENIRTWNKLSDNTLSPGQRLIIWVDKELHDKKTER
jgi:membrane-bound lytic murein transglycosylase D